MQGSRMTTIPVELENRGYDIIIGDSIHAEFPDCVRSRLDASTCALVTNTTLEKLYPEVLAQWESSLGAFRIVLPDGEKYKTIETWRTILDSLATRNCNRDCVLIAFGGGVVGDLTGFAASAYTRGVTFVQVPTTLLAMVDSSVGGKTGVNHSTGKNLVGSFYQPSLVWIDTAMLDTLPKRQFMAGYGEVYKYAFIGGDSMFDFIRMYGERIRNAEASLLTDAISRSVRIKADIVVQDETEQSGVRSLLNFGHTFAHALERYFGYQHLLHGEAVLWGCACATLCADRLNRIPEQSRKAYHEIFQQFPPVEIPMKSLEAAEKHRSDSGSRYDRLYAYMGSDKKTVRNSVRLVLPSAPGYAELVSGVDPGLVIDVMRQSLQTSLPSFIRELAREFA